MAEEQRAQIYEAAATIDKMVWNVLCPPGTFALGIVTAIIAPLGLALLFYLA